ncbi:MAG: molecular chaperone TorD family protein [bacterium]|nr:molecular chaperone TorD family protein [bacterium]
MSLFPRRARLSPEERIEQAALRARLYRVQSRSLLDPPDLELIAFLAANYAFLFPDDFPLPPGEGDMKALRVDFTQLFITSSPPYEAAICDESGHLNAGVTDRVVDFYRARGFDPGLGSGAHAGILAPDHLSVELEFLAHLAEGEAAAWRSRNAEEARAHLASAARFLDEHLLRWMPILTTCVEEDAETPFYRKLAAWTREFALEDRKHIQGLLK